MLEGLKLPTDPNLLVGLARPDDAGVFRLRDDLALVQTVDFFTPIVDDPWLFGEIAAANALSDVYAMGGRPITAMNVTCFPSGLVPDEVLGEVLAGGLAKLEEAGVALAGGHTVVGRELLFGLAVSGLVHPDSIWRKGGARPGDRLVLTKAIGTGILSTALKQDRAKPEALAAAASSMRALNRRAAEAARDLDVHACTDVTGFGLLGHACEMLDGSSLAFRLEGASIPLLPDAELLATAGCLPGGLAKNRAHRETMVRFDPSVPEALQSLLYDPQTSGGLLVALAAPSAEELLRRLHAAGETQAALIGEVIDAPNPHVHVR